MEDYSMVPSYSGRELAARHETTELQAIAPAQGLMAAEQARAVAEVQAALVIAAGRPRNELQARDKLLKACQREGLASSAVYQYTRGGSSVSGPSIRLAEVAARAWGNMTYGFRELSRRPGESDCEAYAWDLESNTKAVRQFAVRHIRDTKAGAKKLSDERDIYEMIANQAQRRVRAAILEIVPGDIIEDAVAECENTMKAKLGDVQEAAKKMLEALTKFHITREMVELRLGHRIDAIQPAEVLSLKKIYQSIRDGMSVAEDWFDMSATQKKPAPAPKPEPKKAEPPKQAEEAEKPAPEVTPEVTPEVEKEEDVPKEMTAAQNELADELLKRSNGDINAAGDLFKELTKGKYTIDDIGGFNDTVCNTYTALLRSKQ